MIASTWYCIAQTRTFDTGCTINVAFDGYDIQFSASVRFGMSAINITRCNIPYDTVFSLRLREGASQWFVDIFCNKEITPNVTIADSPYWTEVNTTAGAGNIILSLNDITSKYNTEQGGAGGFDVDQLKLFLLKNGYTALLDYWKIDEVDNTVLRTDYNVVSLKEIISQRRATGAGSGTGSGYGRLDNWAEWDADTMLTYVLSAKLGVSLNERLKNIEQNGSGLNEDDLKKYLDNNNYLQEKDIADLRTTVNGLDDILNGGTKDVIDTWNEVVDFLDGYKDSEDLATILSGMNTDIANRVLIEDFEKLEEAVLAIDISGLSNRLDVAEQAIKTNATAIATNATNITNLNNRVKTLEDLGLTLEGDAETGYYIKSVYSFVSQGEIISGRRASGSGSGGGGGISEITAQMVTDALGYVPYSSLNPAGYITSAALNGYAKTSDIPSSLPASDVYDWAKAATKPSYTASEVGALSRSGGTMTGTIMVGDFTAFGQTGGNFYLGTPAYPLLLRSNGTTTINSNTLIHSGNYSSYALPLSGGTLTGPLYIDSSSSSSQSLALRSNAADASGACRIQFIDANNAFQGYVMSGWGNLLLAHRSYNQIGVGDSGIWCSSDNGTTKNALIHSGDIGSQSVAGLINEVLTDLNNGSYGRIFTMTSGYGSTDGNKPDVDWVTGITLRHANNPQYRTQLAITTKEKLYLRRENGGTWQSWREIAFTDGNVASATKLQTARTIWGQSFDGTGDVTGAASFANGRVNVPINGDRITFNGSGYSMGILAMNNSNTYIEAPLASDSSSAAQTPILIGWRNGVYPFYISRSGNVLIGTTTDNGAKLQVSGGVTTYGTINMQSVGGIQNAPSISLYDNGVGYYVGSRNAGLGVTDGGCLVYAYGNTPISMHTNGLERMRVLANGNVLIGTTTDNGSGAKLQVNGRVQSGGYTLSNSADYYCGLMPNSVITSGGEATDIWLYNSTKILLYGSSIHLQANTNIAGNLTATGEVISTRRATSSDARLKDNINRLIAEDCLAIVRNLQPSSWDWKENGEHSLGFIAQDIEPLMPYAVTKIKDEVLGQRLNLQYDQFFAPIVGAIQCLDSEVEQLKKKVKYLENKLQEYGYNRY